MRLLVSVRDALEAGEAVAGEAHIIDAKDPARGPLGAVAPDVLVAIVARVGAAPATTALPVSAAIPVSAALGDLADERVAEREARRCALAGVAFVKLGFAGIADATRATTTLAAAVRGATVREAAAVPGCSVVAVAYADADRVGAPSPNAIIGAAARSGATGVLLDTADKRGPGLLERWTPDGLERWVAEARDAGLRTGLAGRLSGVDIATLRALGIDVDVIGVRGAACEGGREGRVVSSKVRALVEFVGRNDDDGQPLGSRAGEERIEQIAS